MLPEIVCLGGSYCRKYKSLRKIGIFTVLRSAGEFCAERRPLCV